MNERATRVADFVDSILKNLNRKKIWNLEKYERFWKTLGLR
jgi:hypothetical protein